MEKPGVTTVACLTAGHILDPCVLLQEGSKAPALEWLKQQQGNGRLEGGMPWLTTLPCVCCSGLQAGQHAQDLSFRSPYWKGGGASVSA